MPRREPLILAALLAVLALAGCDRQPAARTRAAKTSPPASRDRTGAPSRPARRNSEPRPTAPAGRVGRLTTATRPSVGTLRPQQTADALDARTAGQLLVRLLRDSAEYAPTLVVWLVDRSPSAQGLVRAIGQTLREETGPAGGTAGESDATARLLSAVVAFGAESEPMLDPPSSRWEACSEALLSLPVDASGQETTFAALRAALSRYLPYRTQQRRELLLIVLTDEAGDDTQLADELLAQARKYGIPLYVVGPPAPFGRSQALPDRVEARGRGPNSRPWQLLRQGPESRYPERLPLGFWAAAGDLELLDSGFGPFALERVSRASGGCYLALRPAAAGRGDAGADAVWPAPGAARWDGERMQRYTPEYVSDAEYRRLLSGNRARQALHAAAQRPRVELVEMPRLEFVKASEAELARQLSQAQQVAARLEPPVSALYEILEAGESDREQLAAPRWQAGYDLALGRAAAAKARIEGYNAMLAALKRGRSFQQPSSTRWVLEPADTIEASSALQRLADKARQSLTRVVRDHPGTPWARVAQRECDHPIGWQWTER